MAKKASKSDLKKVEKQNKKHKDFPVREGNPKNSLHDNKKGSDKEAYPLPDTNDKQFNNQPEFIKRDNIESFKK